MWSTFSLLSLDDDSDFDVYDETVSMIKALLSLREKKPSSPRVRVKTQETATTSSIASHDGDKRTTERRERERLRGERMKHFPHKFNAQHAHTQTHSQAQTRERGRPTLRAQSTREDVCAFFISRLRRKRRGLLFLKRIHFTHHLE